MLALKKRKRILVLWYSIGENLGDYYLYNTVCSFALKWGYQFKGMDVGTPYEIIAKEARKYDWLWFAGGGIIERGIPDIIQKFAEFHKKAKNIKYGITGLSIGEFDYSDRTDPISYWVNNASFFYTRDDYSSYELNRLAGSTKVIPCVDVVFANEEIANTILAESHCVGINFRTMPYADLTGEIDWKSWRNTIVNCINEKIVVIPDQIDVSKNFDFEYPKQYSPRNAVSVISTMKYGVAMRYHVVLIAARLGKVCIPIDYCPKVARLAEQLGLSELCVHASEPEQLENVVNRYQCNEDNYKRRVKKNVEIMEERAYQMFSDVHKIMEETESERKIFV